MLVAVQLSVSGSYLPPVLKGCRGQYPPQTIISLPLPVQTGCASIVQRARWWCWWLSNYRCWDRTSRRCSNVPKPSVRPRRSFRCRSRLPCEVRRGGRVGSAGGCPTIRDGIVSPAGVQTAEAVKSAPDDHFTAGPDCRLTQLVAEGALVVLVAVQLSVLGSYLPARVERRAGGVAAPDDHFAAGPDCRADTRSWRKARWSCWWLSNYPCWDYICRQCSNGDAIETAPDDHFTAGPDCRVRVSGSGGVGECRWSPGVIGAATRGTSYNRKRVGAVHLNRLGD